MHKLGERFALNRGQARSHMLACEHIQMWELACLRCKRLGPSGTLHA